MQIKSLSQILGILLLCSCAKTFGNIGQLQVPDSAFTDCLKAISEKKGWSTPADFLEIVCHNKSIKSAVGLDKFQNLRKLSLYKNKLTTLDVKALPQLVELNIAGNALVSLELGHFPKLEKVYAFHNQLTGLSIANCPELTIVKANKNQIVKAEFASLPALKKLYLFDNQMEHLEITALTAMKYLDVRQNPMPDEFYDFLDDVKGLTSLHDGNAEDWD